MSSRFNKATKYRHTTAALAKREEWYPDLRTTSSSDVDCLGASAKYVAMVLENGTSLGVLPIEGVGKRVKEMPKVHAHSSLIYDVQFSPVDDALLATGADDGAVKAFRLPDDSAGLTEDITTAAAVLQGHRRRVNTVRFNPVASNVLITGSNDKTVRVWDLQNGVEKQSFDCGGSVTGLSWNYDGSLFATSAEKTIGVIDPRTGSFVQVRLSLSLHSLWIDF